MRRREQMVNVSALPSDPSEYPGQENEAERSFRMKYMRPPKGESRPRSSGPMAMVPEPLRSRSDRMHRPFPNLGPGAHGTVVTTEARLRQRREFGREKPRKSGIFAREDCSDELQLYERRKDERISWPSFDETKLTEYKRPLKYESTNAFSSERDRERYSQCWAVPKIFIETYTDCN